MALKIYNSATRNVEEFVSLEPNRVGVYLCGATVQGAPHIGHTRSALAFDVLVRWLQRSGYEVTMIRNVTDIDDKILAKSQEADKSWWSWAYRHENEFTRAYDALGILRPTYEPRATGHIPEMIALIARLIERGHAYVGNTGNVYFDVASLSDYGSLTRQEVADLQVDINGTESDKRSPHDFALWKAPKVHEPESASWDTPWGRGRPAWHLECSAMSHKYLGETFDIHGGGIDLRFPHHENEQAQSHAAGYGFAKYWMHNAWVTIDGEKMSKSLGNSLIVANILQQYPAVVVRLALGTVHYRSTVAYSDRTLVEATAVWERLSGFVNRAAKFVGKVADEQVDAFMYADYPAEFVAAMDDDLNVSAALAVIHEHVKLGNAALANADKEAVVRQQLLVRAMLDVLGLDPLSSQWAGTETLDAQIYDALDALVYKILENRQKARENKDWAQADALRDSLLEAGIVVEDSTQGASWKIGDK